MNIKKTPKNELQNRMEQFKIIMENSNPGWEIAVIFSKINLYYFTGTMQDGMLIIHRDDEPIFWVRRSYERALNESLFRNIRQMNSYRDAAQNTSKIPETIYLETEVVPIALYSRFQKHFPFKNFKPLDKVIATVRAVKSEYELSLMRNAGRFMNMCLKILCLES